MKKGCASDCHFTKPYIEFGFGHITFSPFVGKFVGRVVDEMSAHWPTEQFVVGTRWISAITQVGQQCLSEGFCLQCRLLSQVLRAMGMVPHALEAQPHVLAMTARNGSHQKVLG